MAKIGTDLQCIMGSNMSFFHLMFSHWGGKSYIAMQETEYCYYVHMNSGKLNSKVQCICR